MSRRRQDTGAQHAASPARLDEDEFAIKPDLVLYPQAAVEVQKIDAAAQQDVLAVIDGLGVFTGSDFV